MKKKAIVETVVILAVSALLLFGVPRFLMERVIVDGPSMETTLQDGDNILVEKVSRYFGALDRFDTVVFYPDEAAKEKNGRYYVKRIIGLPGETVRIEGNTIFINDEPLTEKYGSTQMGAPGLAKNGVTLGEDEYFVLGDNRSISKDSRSESVGVVPLSRIGGKMILRVFPFNKFGTTK
ncbi:MAG: signal peptidase I [Lachnospiraceae bacterium]|nr:signal peptidase I [Lachnospiraceae bacterium]